MDTFSDFDENGVMKLKVKQESKDDYEEICETMNIIFSHFLDNRKGITHRLIIGDRLTFGKKPPQDECIYMSRYIFSQIFNRIRFNREDIDVVVSSYSGHFGNQLPSLEESLCDINVFQSIEIPPYVFEMMNNGSFSFLNNDE